MAQRTYSITTHAKRRMAQRGVKKEHLEIVLKYGKPIYRQGLHFVYISRSRLAKYISPHSRKYVKHLMLVTTKVEDRFVVITTYKHPKAVHHVKKKSKIYWTQA